MDRLIERCAGLDVHKKTVAACVRTPGQDGQRQQQSRTFATTTKGLVALRDWLAAAGVTVVGHGVDRRLLEGGLLPAGGHRGVLAAQRPTPPQRPGRKTDVADAAWICQLVEHRTLKVVTVHHVGFPHAVQILQVTRKRTVGVPHASTRRRRWQTVTVYAITSLGFAQASLARLADLLGGHWAIEALHHLRDVTFAEDASQVRTGAGPHVMACLRNLVIGVIGMLSRAGPVNLAAALRHHARDPARPLATLGITLGSSHA
jgi:hypothetical protein